MTPTWDNGKITKPGDMECITGKMAINMKENGKHQLKMVKELISLPIKMFMLVYTKTVNLMATVSTNGEKEQLTLVNLKLE